MQRKSVHEPMQTGIKADRRDDPDRPWPASADHRRPPDRQDRDRDRHDHQPARQLGSGDPNKQVRCIYVAIGQKGSTIASVRGALEEAGALEYTTIVAAPASDPAGFKYLAPYTGSAIGQHWMYDGKHVLIIFDDLSSRPRPTAPCPCCCAVRRAARPTRATSSTCTPVCWSAARSSPTRWARAR
jgi:F-type H+-transporting ATPase subunit alpha